ncbi:hypothetical protein RMATCC62417_10110 [Rhizopus microsporus]|nr:hypothetical protein RMATCC62417_10110 [Rhizopus microsporus]
MIFVPIQQKGYTLKNRIMNQYLKKHSVNQWGYYSKQFEDDGFSPANPLSFESESVIHNDASFVIKTYTHKKIDLTKMETLVRQILRIDDSRLHETSKLVKRKLLELRNLKHMAFNISPEEAQAKDDLITIYNKSLVNGLCRWSRQMRQDLTQLRKGKYSVTINTDL